MRSSKGRSDSRVVLASTRALLAALPRQTNLAYADDTWSPVGDHTLEQIARQLGSVIVVDDLGAGAQEIGIPGHFGPPTIAVNRRLPALERRFALRHGLAHLVAGELDGAEVRFMSSVLDFMAIEERRADLFALADLVPDRTLLELERKGYTLDERARWLWCELKRFAPAWSTVRVADRVGLRLALEGM